MLSRSFKSTLSSLNRSSHAFNPRPLYTPLYARTILRNMSAAAHPITSTSEPAAPAEDIKAVAAQASNTAKAPKQQQQKGAEGDKKSKKDKKGGSSGPLELNPPPEFFADRIKIFDEYKAKYDKWVSGEPLHTSPRP